ncbi:MAG: DUF1440 domain-containing protein [Chloroflexi bacterium]|nr:DUF1440 domain-containing protein [Chloroflexota bacterium]
MFGNLIRGTIAGTVATWAMDIVTTGMMAGQPESVSSREKSARPNCKSSVDNLIDLVTEPLGWTPDPSQREMLERAIHYGLGAVPGAGYAVVRRYVPFLGAWNGVVYGFLLWIVNDEYVATALGIAGPPDAYPPETHLRGLVGHIALGVTTDTTLDILGA